MLAVRARRRRDAVASAGVKVLAVRTRRRRIAVTSMLVAAARFLQILARHTAVLRLRDHSPGAALRAASAHSRALTPRAPFGKHAIEHFAATAANCLFRQQLAVCYVGHYVCLFV